MENRRPVSSTINCGTKANLFFGGRVNVQQVCSIRNPAFGLFGLQVLALALCNLPDKNQITEVFFVNNEHNISYSVVTRVCHSRKIRFFYC